MKPFIQRSFISPQECETLMKYEQHLYKTSKRSLATNNNKNGKFYTLVGDPLTDAVGLVYKDRLESILDKKLSLSYSYLKRSTRGCYMPWHKNRWECEYTVVIQISDSNWPIGFADRDDTLSGSNPLILGERTKEHTKTTPPQGGTTREGKHDETTRHKKRCKHKRTPGRKREKKEHSTAHRKEEIVDTRGEVQAIHPLHHLAGSWIVCVNGLEGLPRANASGNDEDLGICRPQQC